MMDRYDIKDQLKKNNIDINSCYGKSGALLAGNALKVDKIITGSIERFGEKIAITLKIIDVKKVEIESNTTEYLNLPLEIQKMIEISAKRLSGIQPDQNNVDLLIAFDQPIESPTTRMKLDGPRMGGSFTSGDTGRRLSASKSEGGFDMYPVTFQFGWQNEIQYLSSGNFQGLFEFIYLVGGLESGRLIPSVTVLNGFRIGRKGWEFGFGPSFKVVRKADGFYGDGNNNTEKGRWYLEDEWYNIETQVNGNVYTLNPNPYPITTRLDSRGELAISTGLVLAFGRTFKSGYLNIPVNVYVSPRKDGWLAGFSFGFNIYKKSKTEETERSTKNKE